MNNPVAESALTCAPGGHTRSDQHKRVSRASHRSRLWRFATVEQARVAGRGVGVTVTNGGGDVHGSVSVRVDGGRVGPHDPVDGAADNLAPGGGAANDPLSTITPIRRTGGVVWHKSQTTPGTWPPP
jgi:hypothetical protein